MAGNIYLEKLASDRSEKARNAAAVAGGGAVGHVAGKAAGKVTGFAGGVTHAAAKVGVRTVGKKMSETTASRFGGKVAYKAAPAVEKTMARGGKIGALAGLAAGALSMHSVNKKSK